MLLRCHSLTTNFMYIYHPRLAGSSVVWGCTNKEVNTFTLTIICDPFFLMKWYIRFVLSLISSTTCFNSCICITITEVIKYKITIGQHTLPPPLVLPLRSCWLQSDVWWSPSVNLRTHTWSKWTLQCWEAFKPILGYLFLFNNMNTWL